MKQQRGGKCSVKERRAEREKMQKCLREKIGKGNRKAQKQAKHLHTSEHFNEKIAKLMNNRIFERSNISKNNFEDFIEDLSNDLKTYKR